ncbi:Alpha/Beta hydrolase protein [Coniochaeta sp. 2T2.1]|nr:Alpha/Beta hydrolase protein [Coniochaeta sp. 2T2.1]
MVKEVEGTFEVDGKSLYTKSWLPDTTPKANLVFIHGFSDHINRYQNVFSRLASAGIAVHGYDQRGWGRSCASSPKERGLTGPTSRVLADMVAFITQYLPAKHDNTPLFVMGHSMGGGQVLKLACDVDGAYTDLVKQVRGWLVEAPYIALAPQEQPSWLKVFSARMVGKLLPHKQMIAEIRVESLSHLEEVRKSIREDELMHDTGTIEGMSGMLDRSAELHSGKARPDGKKVKALWVSHGTEDKATSYVATKRWFENCTGDVEDREGRWYEGAYHQLHADTCWEEFAGDVAGWILKRAGGEGEGEVVKGEGEGTKEAGEQEVAKGEVVGTQPVESKL